MGIVNGNKKVFLQNVFDPKMALLVGQRWSEKIGKISTPVSCSTLIYHVALFCRALLYVSMYRLSQTLFTRIKQ